MRRSCVPRWRAVHGAGAVDVADSDRVLLVVVAHAGPLRLAVLGVPGPRLVGLAGRRRSPAVTRSPSSAVNTLCSTIAGHRPRQRADPRGVLGVRVRVGPAAASGRR